MDPLIGQIIDNYKILEVVGKGGMGVVFKALDLNLEKNVALKMIDPFLAHDECFLKRFKTEAKALAKLENENIVGVYALRETDMGLFMVMEYVPARTVSEWLRTYGPFPVNEAVKILRQLLNAINHAHGLGVIHRDIKPNNIMLCDDGTVKVMDFGLAKLILEHGEQSTVTQAAGTLYYMSPEQIKGIKIDNRSDIYSIGMTVYEMLTGRTPFEKGAGEFNIQKQIIEGKIDPPDKFNTEIPKPLIKFIMKAIDKNPDRRFHDIDEMLQELNRMEFTEEEDEEKTRIAIGSTNGKNGSKNKSLKYFSVSAAILIIIALSAYIIITKPFNNHNKEKIKNIISVSDNIDENNNKTDKEIKLNPASLSIISNPAGASVFIDNKMAGKTPFSIDSMALRKYSIKLKMAGYKDWREQNFQLKEGNNPLSVKLLPLIVETKADLTLNAVPSASIFVDDKMISSITGGIIHRTVPAGKHNIKFTSPQFGSKETTVSLNNKQSKSVTCYFQQQIYIQSLNINGEAFWGTIYINGQNTGKTTPGDITLGPGTYNITVRKSGYSTVEKDAVLNITPVFAPKINTLVFHLR